MYPDFQKQEAKRIVAADPSKKYTQVLRELSEPAQSLAPARFLREPRSSTDNSNQRVPLLIGLDSDGGSVLASGLLSGLRIVGVVASGKTRMLYRLGVEALRAGCRVVGIDERDRNYLNELGVSTVSEPSQVVSTLRQLLEQAYSGHDQPPTLVLIDGTRDWLHHSEEISSLISELHYRVRGGNIAIASTWINMMHETVDSDIPGSIFRSTASLHLGQGALPNPGMPRYQRPAAFRDVADECDTLVNVIEAPSDSDYTMSMLRSPEHEG